MAAKAGNVLTVGKVVQKYKSQLSTKWGQIVFDSVESPLKEKLNKSQVMQAIGTVLDSLVPALQSENFDNINQPAFDECKSGLSNISRSFAGVGLTPADTARFILSLRDLLLKYLQEEYLPDAENFNDIVIRVNRLVDELSFVTLEAYMHGREQVISAQSQALLELSTPVVKLWKGILLAPLIGIVDTLRANQIMERLLQKIVDTEARVAILDVTGVPVIDTQVARHIIKTTQAARLLGAEIILTGISPDAALTLTKIGIDLGEIVTRGSLMSGVQTAFQMLQLRIQE